MTRDELVAILMKYPADAKVECMWNEYHSGLDMYDSGQSEPTPSYSEITHTIILNDPY